MDSEVQLTFVREKITLRVPRGTTLLAAQQSHELQPEAPCGGRGTCGKCLVEIRSPGDTQWRQVKACQTPADGDLEIRTPPREAGLSVLDRGEGVSVPREPWGQVFELQVPPCPKGESTADWERLTGALEAVSGRGGWETDIPLAARLGSLLQQTRGHLWAAVCGSRILDLWDCPRKEYMAAFDLGTTTLAGYLLDDHGTAARVGAPNPQARCGADVIQRANYALEHGPEEPARCVREALDALLGQLCGEAGISREQVLAVSLAGNTCMHHLFLGISPDSLARAPYNPALSDAVTLRCADYGLRAHPNARLLMLPVIAGFVGADTVACLVAGDWENRQELTLLVDIGTNGEIVLGNRERMIACSTAAGPALEGAGISCGMRGGFGAVDHVRLENGEIRWSVIGDTQPRGICGSGLIDLAAVLLRTGHMDESGRLEGGEFRLGDTGVVLTQKDVRQLQLAKAAICAGIRLLARRLGAAPEDIDQVCVAGAFGTFMDPDSACRIGLIPGVLRKKIRPVGNAAGEGAKLVLWNRHRWESARRLARQAEFLELATVPDFQDAFVDELEFPEI
ncbi:MAG: ASKHA domain-containing protein [Firmicutes bacterium]|nr:ASKHA domain-containing protein [Bacillota bacterium]